ncbi:MAG TPA: hypothetical protein PKX27_00740 [Bacteroidales bacterium]|nr:hypothetical protein [Bacteroidales bacterium]
MSNVTEEPYIVEIISQGKGIISFIAIPDFFRILGYFTYAYTNANGNKYSITMTTVFVDLNGTLGYSEDERYKLKAGSPASGAGVYTDHNYNW